MTNILKGYDIYHHKKNPFAIKYSIVSFFVKYNIFNILEKIENKRIKKLDISNIEKNGISNQNFMINPELDNILEEKLNRKENLPKEILEILNDEKFIGLGLLGSDRKGKGIFYKENKNTKNDIDLIFYMNGNLSKNKLKELNQYIANITNRKLCVTYYYGNDLANINLKLMKKYLEDYSFLKIINLYGPIYGDNKKIEKSRIEISKLILENCNEKCLNDMDRFFKFHFLPLREKDFEILKKVPFLKKYRKILSSLKNIKFDYGHYILIKDFIDNLSKIHIKNIFEYYKNLEK